MKSITRLTAWLKRLTVRVYIFNIILIVISALVFISVGRLIRQESLEQLNQFILSTVSDHWDQPHIMYEKALHITNALKAQITFYDYENNLIITTSEQPQPSLTSKELQRLKRKGMYIKHIFPAVAVVSVIRDGKIVGYGFFSPKLPFRFQGFVFAIILIFVLIGVFSLFFARSLAKPINRLSATAHAFGKGDFTVRTDLRRNDELGYLAKMFDEMAGRVDSLLRSQKELMTNISHELRTPLSRIRVALDIAAESDKGLSKEQWDDIIHDLDDLEELINDILMAARLDLKSASKHNFEIPFHFEEVDTMSFLEKIATSFNDKSSTHTLELYLEGQLSTIMGDQKLLRRVINNLLDNSQKYSEPHSPIKIKAYDERNMLRIEITDRGIGIDEGDLENIFKPFFRTDQSRIRSTGGVGLGLALSRRIIEAHGGTINLTSTVDKGTVVHLCIPHRSGNF